MYQQEEKGRKKIGAKSGVTVDNPDRMALRPLGMVEYGRVQHLGLKKPWEAGNSALWIVLIGP